MRRKLHDKHWKKFLSPVPYKTIHIQLNCNLNSLSQLYAKVDVRLVRQRRVITLTVREVVDKQ